VRIAVSGAHHVGKTTLIEAFARAHPEYDAEPEPYHALSEAGAAFADPPTEDDYLEQLEHSTGRIEERAGEANVVFDRCPLDFVAYLQVLAVRAGEDFDFDDHREEVASALEGLDLIVFIPATDRSFDGDDIAYPKLRKAVDRRLQAILLEDELSLFEAGKPRIVELSGPTEARLRDLSQLVGKARALA
jgi:hypothetical protein